MAQVMALANIQLDPVYVTSDANLADAYSHGKMGTAKMHLPMLFVLPAALPISPSCIEKTDISLCQHVPRFKEKGIMPALPQLGALRKPRKKKLKKYTHSTLIPPSCACL